VGNILGFIICQYLVINNDLPWQLSMFIVGTFVAIMSILVFFFIEELPKQDSIHSDTEQSLIESDQSDSGNDKTKPDVARLFKSPTVICLTLAFSLIKSIEYGILLWVVHA
jgi:sugar phosphate permease